MKNFQIIARNINVAPMLAALQDHPQLWDAHNLRTTHEMSPHKQASDIWIRFNHIDENVGVAVDDTECYWYPASSILPARNYMYPLLDVTQGDRFGRCVITRLAPGAKIDRHIDYGAPVSYYQRFHLALYNKPGAKFIIGDEEFEPTTGDLYIVANHKEHEVINDSDEERLTMIIDVRTPLFEHIKDTHNFGDMQQGINNSYAAGYTYQVESFEKCRKDFEPFVMKHWNELGLTKEDVPIDFDWNRFFEQDRKGKLHTVTVRKDGQLVGYHIAFIGSHPHYKSTLHAMVDLYYLEPTLRRGKVGMKMFKFAEEELKQIGVKKIYTGCKVKLDHTRLFEFLGYEFSDKQFIKVLK